MGLLIGSVFLFISLAGMFDVFPWTSQSLSKIIVFVLMAAAGVWLTLYGWSVIRRDD